MTKGFTFGKFLPFHNGHKALIDFALKHCDQLYVVVCASDFEHIAVTRRCSWLSETYQLDNRVVVVPFSYSEDDLPNTSESSRDVSKVWSEKFLELLPTMNRVFTSETYGQYVAEYMGIEHIPFNPDRNIVSVSASDIKTDIVANWKYLPEAVQHDLAFKTVIHGTESTGKTTLAHHLAEKLNGTVVEEAGRALISDSTDFPFEALYDVIDLHTKWIQEASPTNSPFVFIDTNLYTTVSYGSHFFHKRLEVSSEVEALHRGHLNVYLGKEVPFVQDGTRLNENERNQLDVSHRHALIESGVAFIELNGNYEERNIQAVEEVSKTSSEYYEALFLRCK